MRRDARSLALCLLAATLAGCATTQGHRPSATVEILADPGKAWKERIDQADAARLDALPALWASARAAAKPRFAAALTREGPLLDPARALHYPALPPGAYHCRAVKLGPAQRTGAPRQPAFRTLPSAFCHVGGEDEAQSFTIQTGTERPSGWLYPDGDTRYVFLGAFPRSKAGAPVYGAVPGSNALGVVERVAQFRWRLTLVPADRSAPLTAYELTPVPAEQQPGD